jgi:hypothetical protein
MGGIVIRIASGMFACGKVTAMRRTGNVSALAMLIIAKLLEMVSKKERFRNSPVASLTKTFV